MPKLEIRDVAKFTLCDLSLDVHGGEILTLLGESGSGKTTLMRIIAGLERPDRGAVSLDGRTVCSDFCFVEPENRHVGMMFQSYRLFPHMTVRKNISFGLYRKSRKERREIVAELLQQLQLDGLEDRYPHQLSGGQQQRVALARTLATRPTIILFDEPFANLDENLRDRVRDDLKTMIKSQGLTAIFVTHDKRDALALSDRVAILHEGRIEQIGSPEEVYATPSTVFAARFFGETNLVQAQTTDQGFQTELGFIPCKHTDEPGTKGLLSLRPHWCKLNDGDSQLSGTVKRLVYNGDFRHVELALPTSSFHLHVFQEVPIAVGDTLGFSIHARSLSLIRS